MLFLQLLFTVLVGLSVVLLLVGTLAAIWKRLRGGSELKKLGLKLIKPKPPFDRITYESRPRKNDLVVRIVAWGLAATIVVLSLVPPDLRPETGVPHKLEHFLIFAATGAAFGLGYEARRGRLAIQLVIFAGVVEIAQLFAPGRHARLSDFLVDAVAICAGSIAGSLAKEARTHWM
jgi:VanZ family protein